MCISHGEALIGLKKFCPVMAELFIIPYDLLKPVSIKLKGRYGKP